jgi:hypothetical protein
LSQEKRFTGIRIIFQDIALVSHAHPGHLDYTAAATGINQLLHSDNGPWLLVAWSTWGADGGDGAGERYARELFEHLQERLPQGIRPFKHVVLDKSPYTSNGMHSSVKTEDELNQDEKQRLLNSIQEVILSVSNLAVLSQWEHDVRASASKIVHDLWNTAESPNHGQADQLLGGLLYNLAKAEDGTLREENDISHPLYQILSKLLYDKSNHLISSPVQVVNPQRQNIPKDQLNTMLHWDGSVGQTSPGSIYKWPLDTQVDLGTLKVSNLNFKEFILDTFVKADNNKRKAASNDANFLVNATLVLIDITPACDHANSKAFWRRFLVGVKVMEVGLSHFVAGGKLSGEHLKETPMFEVIGEKFKFIFNSKLVLSLSDANEYQSIRTAEPVDPFLTDVSKLECVGRIRDELLKDIQSWYGRMATRPGIVSL